MEKKLIVCAFIFLQYQLLSFAQPVSDAGMWNTISLEKELSEKMSISMDEEFRLKENFTKLNLLYTNVGASYKAARNIKIGLTYRLIEKWKQENPGFSYRHRLMFDMSFKYKFNSWSVSYRSRIQSELRDIYTSAFGMIPEWYWRNKFDLKKKLRRYTPYLGAEFRYQLVDPRGPESNFGWHRARMYGGVDFEINNTIALGIYYLVQHDINIVNPQYLYILGLQYSVLLKYKD
jgi:hypothetical protein